MGIREYLQRLQIKTANWSFTPMTENEFTEELESIVPNSYDKVVEELVDRTYLTEGAAEAVVNGECEMEERDGVVMVTGLTNIWQQVHDLDHPVGEPTGDYFYGLEILEDTGHPMVRELGFSYKPRPVEGDRMDVEVVTRAMANRDFSTLLIGETGVGKNVLLKYISQKTNRPLMRVNFGLDTTYEKLVGFYSPTESENGEVNFEWRDGVLTKAVKNGWIFVADEINVAPPEVGPALNGINEGYNSRELVIDVRSEVLTHDNGGIHDEFISCATMNPPRYGGTSEMNLAFKGRFFPISIGYLESQAEEELLMEKTNLDKHDKGQTIAKDLVGLANRIRSQTVDISNTGDQTLPVGTRQLEQVCHFIVDEEGNQFMSPKKASVMILKGYCNNPSDWRAISATIDRTFKN